MRSISTAHSVGGFGVVGREGFLLIVKLSFPVCNSCSIMFLLLSVYFNLISGGSGHVTKTEEEPAGRRRGSRSAAVA